MKHRVYAIIKKVNNGEKMYVYSRNKSIRSLLLNILLLVDNRDHFINWCKYHQKDPADNDAWEEYIYFVRPGEDNYFLGTLKMSKKDQRWKHVYDNKKMKYLSDNFAKGAKIEMVELKEKNDIR